MVKCSVSESDVAVGVTCSSVGASECAGYGCDAEDVFVAGYESVGNGSGLSAADCDISESSGSSDVGDGSVSSAGVGAVCVCEYDGDGLAAALVYAGFTKCVAAVV